MRFMMYDRVEIDDAAGVKELADGRIVARPRVARTGIQLYRGSEVGRPEMDVVRVYRSPEEVFSDASMSSFLHVPVTNDHPPEMVTPQNFVKYSKGWTGDEAQKEDNKFLRVPMMLADHGLVQDYKNGKRQLSNGYTCDLDWTGGTDPDSGEKYDASQVSIRGNHVAVVDAARGGKDLRIGDAMVIDKDYTAAQRGEMAKSGEAMPNGGYPIKTKGDLSNAIQAFGRNPTAAVKKHIMKRARALGLEKEIPANWTDAAYADDADLRDRVGYNGERTMTVRNIMVADVSLEVSDVAASVITAHLTRMDKSVKDLQDQLIASQAAQKTLKDAADAAAAKHATEIAAKDEAIKAKDAENATLKTQVTDAMSPAKLDEAVRDRAVIVSKGRAILGDKLVVDGKTNPDIMRQVVDAKMKDQAKDWTEAQVKISFDTMTADVKIDSSTVVDDKTLHRPGHGPSVLDVVNAFKHGNTTDASDPRTKAYEDNDAYLRDAWKNQPGSQTKQ